MLFRPSKEANEWRLVYPEANGLSNEEMLAKSGTTIERLLPGNPKPEDYAIKLMRPYKIHQRLVDSMREGRIVLASDAAHLCCP